MKRLALLLVMLPILLTGCTDHTEIGDRAIIQVAAIDCSDSGYHVSAMLFSSGGGSGDTIDASLDNVIKVTGDGATVAEAFDNISLIDGKEIYLSEMKLLVLGNGFLHRDIAPVLNTLFYDMRCSLNMPVCCADNAETLTDLRFTEGITAAEKPLDMMKNANREGVSPNTLLLDVLCGIESGKPVLLPMFAETENGFGMTADDEGKTAVLVGTRTVAKGRLAEFNDREKTVGLMLLSGETDRINVNFFHDGTEQTCEAYGIRTEIVPQLDGNAVRVTARFRGRNGAKLSDQMKESALSALTELVKAAM